MMEMLKMLNGKTYFVHENIVQPTKNHFTNFMNVKSIFLISIEKAASSFIAARLDLYF